MVPIEEVGTMLDDIVNELPEDLYKYLNGGIVLLPEEKLHPKNKHNDLYIMGDYNYSSQLGRSIKIYYGSLTKVYGSLTSEQIKPHLRDLVLHELTHHLESLSGEIGLEIKDAIDLARYERGEKI